MKNKKMLNTSTLVKIAILSAIGYMLMFISIPIPIFFPGFLKIDISDVCAMLGGLSTGPFAGVIIVFIKNLLQVVTGMSTTGGVGEFANFLIEGIFIFIVSTMYKNNFKSLIKGLLLGTLAMIIAGCFVNYFIILPAYEMVGFPIEVVVSMANAINKLVTDKMSFVICMVAPFNALKAVIISLITIPLYKKLDRVL
jgi:riboflavin transporter FmnP